MPKFPNHLYQGFIPNAPMSISLWSCLYELYLYYLNAIIALIAQWCYHFDWVSIQIAWMSFLLWSNLEVSPYYCDTKFLTLMSVNHYHSDQVFTISNWVKWVKGLTLVLLCHYHFDWLNLSGYEGYLRTQWTNESAFLFPFSPEHISCYTRFILTLFRDAD